MPGLQKQYPPAGVTKNSGDASEQVDGIRLIHGGREYFDLLLQLIGAAKESIHLQTYIYNDDDTGQQVAAALKAAVQRKVAVYLLADGYASQDMPDGFIKGLVKAGIHFRFFEPLFKSRHFYFGRRMHHKIFVADARYALVGGLNIADRYNDTPGQPAWLDFALYAEGSIAGELCILCWKTWKGFPLKMKKMPCGEKDLPGRHITGGKSGTVVMRRNDWIRRKSEISETYFSMLRNAKSHITIVCSYFLPGKILRRLFKAAAARGVSIKVITAGPSDVMLAKHAERWLYDWLLRNKIELYEYQPSVLHAKLAVCDGEWFTIGSYNINNLSAYASIELNLDVHQGVLAKEATRMIDHMIENDCRRITTDDHAGYGNIFKQFIHWSSYQFIRLLFYMFTFYYKQKE